MLFLCFLFRWFFAPKNQGCQNGAFGKRSFCWGDTRHFRHFRRFLASEEQNPLFLSVECNLRMFSNFRQNHLFSAGDKITVFQNDHFDNPERRGRDCFWRPSESCFWGGHLTEPLGTSKGISKRDGKRGAGGGGQNLENPNLLPIRRLGRFS